MMIYIKQRRTGKKCFGHAESPERATIERNNHISSLTARPVTLADLRCIFEKLINARDAISIVHANLFTSRCKHIIKRLLRPDAIAIGVAMRNQDNVFCLRNGINHRLPVDITE